MSAARSHTRTMSPEPYREPGPHTELTTEQQHVVLGLHRDPVELCRAAQSLIVLPPSASEADLSPRRLAERNLRPARAILDAALQRDERPFTQRRELRDRVTAT